MVLLHVVTAYSLVAPFPFLFRVGSGQRLFFRLRLGLPHDVVRLHGHQHRGFLGQSTQSHAVTLGQSTQSHTVTLGQSTQSHAVTLGQSTQSHAVTLGQSTQSHAVTLGQSTQ